MDEDLLVEKLESPEPWGLMRLPLAVPPMMERAFGYHGDRRYVAFYVNVRSGEFGCDDGVGDHVPVEPTCWRQFIEHLAIRPLLESLGFFDQPVVVAEQLVDLGEKELSEYFKRTRRLLLDRDERVLYIGRSDNVLAFLTIRCALTETETVGEESAEQVEVARLPISAAVRDAFRAWLDAQIDTAIAQFRLGLWCKKEERYEEALAALQRAVALESTLLQNAAFQDCLGWVYMGLLRYPEAIPAFEHAIWMQPDVAGGYQGLGMAYFGSGRFEEAISALRKRIELEPSESEGYIELGLALAAARRHADAIGAFRTAIQLDPENAEAHSHLGAVFTGIGDTASAVREYRIAKDLGLDKDLEEELFKLL